MSRPSLRLALVVFALACGCEQLGNPTQFTTGPTQWKDARGHLITQTRSFRDEKTIRRLASEGMRGFDYSDASIGPSQTLTVVIVVPRALGPTRRNRVGVVTIFKMDGRPPITRRWTAPTSSNRWTAAFALPEPPTGAVTSVAP